MKEDSEPKAKEFGQGGRGEMEDLLNDLSDGDGDESIDFSPPPISSH